MAISKLEVGAVPLGVGGDSLRSAAAKINANFSDTTHAASKLVGTTTGTLPLAEDIANVYLSQNFQDVSSDATKDFNAFPLGDLNLYSINATNAPPKVLGETQWLTETRRSFNFYGVMQIARGYRTGSTWTRVNVNSVWSGWVHTSTNSLTYTATTTNTPNVVVDDNGVLKRSVGGYNRKRISVAVNTSVTSQSIPTGINPSKIIAVNVIARSGEAVIPINYGGSYQFKWSIYLTNIILETTADKTGLVGSNWIIDITYED